MEKLRGQCTSNWGAVLGGVALSAQQWPRPDLPPLAPYR